ncbi:MAG: pseudouridine synthase [Kiritimatiellia bacterium]
MMRLEKFLADAGIASRRQCARYITAGKVRVNGKIVTEPGQRIDPVSASVTFDGRRVPARQTKRRTIALYKPRGYITSRSSVQGRTIFDLLPEFPQRLVPAGRLDKNSEGLLVLSSDGELVNRLTHPGFGHEKTYRVTVSGAAPDSAVKKLRRPAVVEGRKVKPVKVTFLREGAKNGRLVLEIVLREGRKRQIRKMCASAGLRVHRLLRVGIGRLTLEGIKPGKWRDLKKREISLLFAGKT